MMVPQIQVCQMQYTLTQALQTWNAQTKTDQKPSAHNLYCQVVLMLQYQFLHSLPPQLVEVAMVFLGFSFSFAF